MLSLAGVGERYQSAFRAGRNGMIQQRNERQVVPWRWFLLTTLILAAAGCKARPPTAALPTLASEAHLSPSPVTPVATAEAESPMATAGASLLAVEPPPPTPIPTAASTATVSDPPPTPADPITHTVAAGETLTDIAPRYSVTVDELAAANGIQNANAIAAGQVLQIPQPGGQATPTALAVATPAGAPIAALDVHAPPQAEPAWDPSLISGDLESGYPLLRYSPDGRMRIHAQPGTYAAPRLDAMAALIQTIFVEIEAEIGRPFWETVDVYLAGTLFEINPALQGFTQSQRFRSFVLVNGVFHPGERNYILGHELTHVATTNLLGRASSTMIHEGLAVALPYHHLHDEAEYLPLQETCALAYHDRERSGAFRPARTLLQYNYEEGFNGHIRTYFNYHLSGCFVDFLLDYGGMAALDQVYDSGAYATVYGQTFGELDAAWQASLAATEVNVDPARFVDTVYEMADAYEWYVSASEDGVHYNYQAYLALNEARLALNRGRLDEAQAGLKQYARLMGE